MKENFEIALKALLKHEGGYVNHKDDPGGMTNLGVTKRVWEEWVGHAVDEQTMRGLTPDAVAPLYKRGIGMLYVVTIYLLAWIWWCLIVLLTAG